MSARSGRARRQGLALSDVTAAGGRDAGVGVAADGSGLDHCAFGDPDARRDAAGSFRAAIVLPEVVRGPIGDAVSDRLVEPGLAVPLRA
jgi:hypothetical protein